MRFAFQEARNGYRKEKGNKETRRERILKERRGQGAR